MLVALPVSTSHGKDVGLGFDRFWNMLFAYVIYTVECFARMNKINSLQVVMSGVCFR